MTDHYAAMVNQMPRNARNMAIYRRHAMEANVYATLHGIALKIAYPCAFQPMVADGAQTACATPYRLAPIDLA